MIADEVSNKLIQNGFVMYAHCTCNGTYQDKYKLPNTNWKVIIKPRKGLFLLRFAGRNIEHTTLNDFNDIFEKHIQEIKQA